MIKRKHNDRGTGMAEVLVYVLGLAIVWFVVYFVMDWVYTTKENRLNRRWLASQERSKNKEGAVTLRGPQGYQAYCWGVFSKKCKT